MSEEKHLNLGAIVLTPMVFLACVTLAWGTFVAWQFGRHGAVFTIPIMASTAGALGIGGLLARSVLRGLTQLEDLSLTDTLTRLPNRRALHRDVARTVLQPGEECALALLDLDGFKLVNDHYGHNTGDRMLHSCATIIQEVCDREARAYRLGGDEFALLVQGPIGGNLLEGICRSLLGRLQSPVPIGDRELAISASIGLTRRRAGHALEPSELLREADVAMYASKRGGKARCTWFSGHFDRDSEAMRKIDEEMRTALAEGQFRVHYQPLVHATSREIVAVEALLRWARPDGRNVGPNVFVPVAESTGLINPIGLWVLRQACTDARAWGDITLSVNISPAQLRNPEFPIQLGQILEETGFEPERLELEITETCLVVDPVVAGRSLDVIRGFGVNIALDDFGTGYASIGFLRQFRFEKLKLDRSLIVESANDEGSRAMMLSSISVARALKMGVTAEGVETEAQADLARTAGCDQMQGWLYFRPMPAADMDQHLAAPDDAGRQSGKTAA
jgi:diguanylate cyclase (GGDEF)-like protein